MHLQLSLAALLVVLRKMAKSNSLDLVHFAVKNRAARQGRNPKTGEAMQIKASKTVGFKCSSSLKGSL